MALVYSSKPFILNSGPAAPLRIWTHDLLLRHEECLETKFLFLAFLQLFESEVTGYPWPTKAKCNIDTGLQIFYRLGLKCLHTFKLFITIMACKFLLQRLVTPELGHTFDSWLDRGIGILPRWGLTGGAKWLLPCQIGKIDCLTGFPWTDHRQYATSWDYRTGKILNQFGEICLQIPATMLV